MVSPSSWRIHSPNVSHVSPATRHTEALVACRLHPTVQRDVGNGCGVAAKDWARGGAIGGDSQMSDSHGSPPKTPEIEQVNIPSMEFKPDVAG